MSSMSCWIFGLRISDGCSARAFARSTGCPMRAIFKIDICELYAGQISRADDLSRRTDTARRAAACSSHAC